jgi:hypothetical protein
MAKYRPVKGNNKELKDLKESVGALDMQSKDLSNQFEDLYGVIKNDLVGSINKLTTTIAKDTADRKKAPKSGGTTGKTGGKTSPKSTKKTAPAPQGGMMSQFANAFKAGQKGSMKDNFKSISSMFAKTQGRNEKGQFTKKQSGFGHVADEMKSGYKKGAAKAVGKKAGGKGISGGMGKALSGLKSVGGGMMGAASGLLKAAGPIGAAFSIGMEVVDFFNSGKAAQTISDIGSVLGIDTTEQTKATFTASKKYREIQADFNIIKPIERENQKRMDMLDYQKGIEQDRLGFNQSLVKDEYNQRFSEEKDWLNFAHGQAMQNIDAEHARRKTLFMGGMKTFEKYIGIGERALNAIGSSTEAVLNTITSVGKNLGASVGSMLKMSTAAQGLSKLLGSSSEEVLGMSNAFRLMNKSSLETGTNLVAGIKEFAEGNGAMASVVMKDMVDSSAELYKFSSGTAENFAKQAIQLNKMGTSMSAMMKASDSMVLNYKDSIKAEMSLSAMLGHSVDLSETRAKLMSGDQAGAAESLRNSLGGQDVGSMNAFQKQQLSQATGMDVEQLMSLQQGGEGGVDGTLDKKNAEKTGKDIANGALKQDIANEAAKLGAEQAFRRKMMEFEQKERKGMLFIEQMQRLEGIAMEQKWRVKLAAAEKQGTLDLEIGRMQAESASKLVSSVFNSASQEYKSKLDADKSLSDSQRASMLQSYETSKAGSEEYIQKLVQSGVLTSESASQTMTTLGQKFANGEMLNQQQIADLLTKEGAFQAAQDKAKAEQEEMDKKKAEAAAKAEEKSLNWIESGMAQIGAEFGWLSTSGDFFGYGAKQLNEQAAANTALQNLNAEQDILTQQNKGMADVQSMIKDNDNLRGIAHSQKFDYQAKVQNESVKATYAVVASIEALALAQGKAITLDTSGVASSINRLQGVNYTIAQ